MTRADVRFDDQKGVDLALVRRVLRYLRPYTGLAGLALGMAALIAAVQPTFGLIQLFVIDNYLTPFVEGGSPAEALFRGVLLAAGLYLLLKVVEFGAQYAFVVGISLLGQRVLYDIRADIFTKLQRLQLSYFDQNPVGRLITRVTSDVDAINQFITGGLTSLVQSSLLIVAYAGIMLWVDWRLALISFTVLPVMFVATNFFRTRIRTAFRETRFQQAAVNSQLNENITGMGTVQLFGREARSSVEFDGQNRELLTANLNTVKWFSLFMPTVALLTQISLALVLYVGGVGILGENGVTIGTLVAFVAWVAALFQPIQDLADVFNNLQAAMASSERIFGVLDTKQEINDKPAARKLERFRGQVDLEGVWFSYDPAVTADTPESDERWVLRGIDLHIAPGESVALVGATGAGKTSITSLVSRFYDVQRGSVRVDGTDVRDLEQHDLRRHVGVVLQDVFLFAGTIRSNLTLGDDTIEHERVEQAARYVGVHDFITRMEHGYDTEVRERGSTLSTGQKQLLAFARALIQNPDILLVLDEATASVDTETESRIQEALLRVMEGRTSIIIAHRLSTIEHCDRIVVMRRGRVVEMGSHRELLDAGGYYARLHSLQYAGEAASEAR